MEKIHLVTVIFKGKNLKDRKIILFINFIFARIFFLIASSQIFENYAILINHGPFFQGEDSLKLDLFQFLEINSLWLKALKTNFPKQNFY